MTYLGAPLSSERQDWATPWAFILYLRRKFGFVPTLDAAASALNTKSGRYFTACQDSLKQDWFGHVWLNPPFGKELIGFLQKCADEIKRDEVLSIYALVPARTDTKWFHEIVLPTAAHVYLIKGRLTFESSSATPGANAPFPSMLIVWDSRLLPQTIGTLEPSLEERGF